MRGPAARKARSKARGKHGGQRGQAGPRRAQCGASGTGGKLRQAERGENGGSARYGVEACAARGSSRALPGSAVLRASCCASDDTRASIEWGRVWSCGQLSNTAAAAAVRRSARAHLRIFTSSHRGRRVLLFLLLLVLLGLLGLTWNVVLACLARGGAAGGLPLASGPRSFTDERRTRIVDRGSRMQCHCHAARSFCSPLRRPTNHQPLPSKRPAVARRAACSTTRELNSAYAAFLHYLWPRRDAPARPVI